MDVALNIQDDETHQVDAAAQHLIECARAAVAERGAFHIALSGGSTPRALYQRLKSAPFVEQMPWEQVHIYFGDERCVPPDHEDSNYRMAQAAFLAEVNLPPGHVHRIAGEQAPQAAATQYADLLKQHLPIDTASGFPCFDLVLLGLGPDGHIASLFPGTPALDEKERSVTEVFVAKFNSWRVSLTLPVLNSARELMLLVSGDKKADVLRHVLQDVHNAAPLPIQYLQPRGRFVWFLDRGAARYLRSTSDSVNG